LVHSFPQMSFVFVTLDFFLVLKKRLLTTC
jgi:hypothetical protein